MNPCDCASTTLNGVGQMKRIIACRAVPCGIYSVRRWQPPINIFFVISFNRPVVRNVEAKYCESKWLWTKLICSILCPAVGNQSDFTRFKSWPGLPPWRRKWLGMRPERTADSYDFCFKLITRGGRNKRPSFALHSMSPHQRSYANFLLPTLFRIWVNDVRTAKVVTEKKIEFSFDEFNFFF